MKRYNRISKISDKDQQKLCDLVHKTPEMTQYGHRARTAVMLPLDIAEQVAQLADQKSISVGQAILDILQICLENQKINET